MPEWGYDEKPWASKTGRAEIFCYLREHKHMDYGNPKARPTTRRSVLRTLGGAGALVIVGCGSERAGGTDGGPSGCPPIPDETLGPYPDRLGMLTDPTYNRSDITEGKPGLPLRVVLSVVNTSRACASVPNAQVIIWQCDADGHYSEYAGQPGGFDGTNATFLRGVQTTDGNGQVTFRTIYPGWYPGRATHIHVEVYVNGVAKKVTQLAFPETITSAVYGTGVYAAKGQNPQPNATDNVFADSLQSELATLVGDIRSGYTATLTLGIAL